MFTGNLVPLTSARVYFNLDAALFERFFYF